MEKLFDFNKEEEAIYDDWLNNGLFKPKFNKEKENFSISIPPPNVTGQLHIGHALNNTIQDFLLRYNRMKGKNVLWLTGVDHAGIATQMVVERELYNKKLPSRIEMGRQKFLEKVWEWKNNYGDEILKQQKKLGLSPDWSHSRFTMDDDYCDAVIEAFCLFHEKGLIFRNKRLVNWDPKLGTVISDLEVENKEVDGKLYHIKYHFKNSDEYIIVATTRPETLLGDVAVAVNPKDDRYKDKIGKFISLPLCNRKIPVIADDHADMEVGSGAVKITPGHDFNDYEVGKRNKLTIISILNFSGQIINDIDELICLDENSKINNEARENIFNNIDKSLLGLDVNEARKIIVKKLEAEDKIFKIEDKKIIKPFGDRSGAVIEPMLVDQWYLDSKKLSANSIKLVKDKKIRFIPENWEKRYFSWLENIEPWCISRQLWWGHQIPAYFCSNGEIFVARSSAAAITIAQEKLNENVTLIDSEEEFPNDGKIYLKQDKDVLDTWFSSQLWPFATLGWPKKDIYKDGFYPTSLLVTAFDIIHFWVARMIMSSESLLDDVPFKEVYIHALVLDEHGQKMSKTKGNVINPIEIIDEYGADCLRFSLISALSQGQDIRLSNDKIINARNFITKLWNASRYFYMKDIRIKDDYDFDFKNMLPVNKWMLAELANSIDKINMFIDEKKFKDYGLEIYNLVWNNFCDWYIEATKPYFFSDNNEHIEEIKNVASYVLLQILKLIHPVSPFISEKLFQDFTCSKEYLLNSLWPEIEQEFLAHKPVDNFSKIIKLISEIRSVKSTLDLAPSLKFDMILSADQTNIDFFNKNKEIILFLGRIDKLEFNKDSNEKNIIEIKFDDIDVKLISFQKFDFQQRLNKLQNDIAKIEQDNNAINKKLENKNFVQNAPKAIIEKQHQRLKENNINIDTILSVIENIKKIQK